MLKKLFYIFIAFITTSSISLAATRTLGNDDIQNGILPTKDAIITTTEKDGFNLLDIIVGFIKGSIFDLLMMISLGIFLFIGARLVIARGDPEQFKKAMLSFVYAGVGLFIVAASWAAVTLIAGLKF